MKMTTFEKQFVNSPSHSQQVGNHAEKLLKLVDFRAGQKYLDMGCGNGAAPIHLAQRYHLDVTGVDVDPDQIQLAEESSQTLNNARFLTVSGTQLPFDASEFDIVATNKVTHHIPNWEATLAEMVRVLKPNGYFIYADLVYPSWLATLGRLVAKNRAGFPTSEKLKSFVAKNNLIEIYLSKSMVHYETVLQKK